MKRIRMIKNTIMIGLVIAFAGASVLTMNFIGDSPRTAGASFSESKAAQIPSNLQNGSQNSAPGMNGNRDMPSDMAKSQGQAPRVNGNSENGNSGGSGFVPDNNNSNSQNNSDSSKNSDDNKSSDKQSGNSNETRPNDSQNNDGNQKNNGSQNNYIPDNNSGNNGFNRGKPDVNDSFTPDNNQNRNGSFMMDNHRGLGDRHMMMNIVKYGIVVFDSFIIGALVMYLILSGFNKKYFNETLGGAKRILAFVFGTFVIAFAVGGAQIITAEIISHLI